MNGARPDLVIVDEVAAARPWVGPRMLLHDPDLDAYTAPLDADGRFTIELPAAEQWRKAFADAAEAYSRSMTEIAATVVPSFAELCETLRRIAAAEAELVAVEHADPRERALAAKRRPGRTGPPAAPLDDRRRGR